MQSLGPPDQEAVEKGWEGLSLGTPKGTVTGDEVAVVREGNWGSVGILGGHAGRVQGVI